MAWGIWKKFKDGLRKAALWTKDHVVKPVVDGAKKIINSVPMDKVIDFGIKLLPNVINSGGGKLPVAPSKGGRTFASK